MEEKYRSIEEDDDVLKIKNFGNYEGIDFQNSVILQSDDQVHPLMEYMVYKDAVKISELIRDILNDQENDENGNNNDDRNENIIPIPNVNGITLGYIVQYMNHCLGIDKEKAYSIPKPLPTVGKLEDWIPKWDVDFLNTDLVRNGDEKQHELLLNVILAANFLHIPNLLELGCAKMASIIKDKNPDQIRDTFGIENDFSSEEKEKIKQERYWMENN